MEKVKNIIVKIYMIITIIYIFFAHISIFSDLMNINTAYLIISILFLGYIIIVDFKRHKLEKIDIILLSFIVYLAITTTIQGWSLNAIKFFSFFSVINIIALILKKKNGWEKTFLKPIIICTLIHSIFIILHAIFPEFILQIDKWILNDTIFEVIKMGTNNNYYSGITAGPASAGLFATILIGLTASSLICKKKIQYKDIVFLIIGFIALLLSQKRSFVIASIVAVIVIVFLVNRVEKRIRINKKTIGVFIAIVCAIAVIVLLIPQTRNIVNRFFNNNRILSGRDNFYRDMIQWFIQNTLIGIGIGTTQTVFGCGGHNIYIQMLAECGILGGIIYFIYLFKIILTNINIVLRDKIIDKEIIFSTFMHIVLIIYGLTGNPIYDYSYLVLFMYILMMPQVIKRERYSIEESKCNNTSI